MVLPSNAGFIRQVLVEAIRALLSGQPAGNDIWVALTWCMGILVVYIYSH